MAKIQKKKNIQICSLTSVFVSFVSFVVLNKEHDKRVGIYFGVGGACCSTQRPMYQLFWMVTSTSPSSSLSPSPSPPPSTIPLCSPCTNALDCPQQGMCNPNNDTCVANDPETFCGSYGAYLVCANNGIVTQECGLFFFFFFFFFFFVLHILLYFLFHFLLSLLFHCQ